MLIEHRMFWLEETQAQPKSSAKSWMVWGVFLPAFSLAAKQHFPPQVKTTYLACWKGTFFFSLFCFAEAVFDGGDHVTFHHFPQCLASLARHLAGLVLAIAIPQVAAFPTYWCPAEEHYCSKANSTRTYSNTIASVLAQDCKRILTLPIRTLFAVIKNHLKDLAHCSCNSISLSKTNYLLFSRNKYPALRAAPFLSKLHQASKRSVKILLLLKPLLDRIVRFLTELYFILLNVKKVS